MIVSDLSEINRKITNVEYIEDIKKIKITRFDNSIEYIDVGSSEPDTSENDQSLLSYISNKPRKLSLASLDDYPSPIELDMCTLPDSSQYLYTGIDWQIIRLSKYDIGEIIYIDKYKKNKMYAKGAIVQLNNNLYRSNYDTDESPTVGYSKWSAITEYDMFVSICEYNSPAFNGTFVVSNEMYVFKEFIINNVETLASWFDTAIPSNIIDTVDGISLNTKVAGVNDVILSKDLSVSDVIIQSIEVYGVADGTIDSELNIKILIDSNVFSITRFNTNIERYLFSYNDTFLHGTDGTNELFRDYIFISNTESSSNFNLQFSYSINDLSMHKIKKIVIKYKEKE